MNDETEVEENNFTQEDFSEAIEQIGERIQETLRAVAPDTDIEYVLCMRCSNLEASGIARNTDNQDVLKIIMGVGNKVAEELAKEEIEKPTIITSH